MTFRDFLKDLEGQKLSFIAASAAGGIHVLTHAGNMMGAACTLERVEEDFIVLEFVKTSMFNAAKTLYIPISMVYCDFLKEKK